METITVWSEAFRIGERIPTRYTCDGRDISPPISWTNMPSDTRSITLMGELIGKYSR